MSYLFSLNHLALIYLGVLTLTYAQPGNEVHLFDSEGWDEDAGSLTEVLHQMKDMQAKMTRLEESESSLKRSVSIFIEKSTHSQQQIDKLTNEMTTLKYAAQEKDDRIHVLENTLAHISEMVTSNTSRNAGNMKVGHSLDKTGPFIETDRNMKREKDIRQSSESVFFSAYLDHVINNLGKDQPIVYNMVLQNEAGAYSETSGIFHVPIAGVYLFSWSASARVIPGGNPYDVWVKLVVNGIHQIGAAAESQVSKDDNQGSNTVILRVNKGDEVWTASQNAGSNLFGADNERTTSFTGVLLYPN